MIFNGIASIMNASTNMKSIEIQDKHMTTQLAMQDKFMSRTMDNSDKMTDHFIQSDNARMANQQDATSYSGGGSSSAGSAGGNFG